MLVLCMATKPSELEELAPACESHDWFLDETSWSTTIDDAADVLLFSAGAGSYKENVGKACFKQVTRTSQLIVLPWKSFLKSVKSDQSCLHN